MTHSSDSVLHIAFIGFGLIGGSIAKGLRRRKLPVYMYAFARHRDILETARDDGTIDQILDSLTDERLKLCDYIFLCAPVGDAVQHMTQIKSLMKPGAILTDVGSTKTQIHRAAEELGLSNCFIGGHPMAGSEKSGYAHATDHLLENAYYVLTHAAQVTPQQTQQLQQLISALGSIVLVLDCDRHDYVVAAISHLPHIIASSLVNLVRDSDDQEHTMKTVAAGGFKDITRIASASPVMWQQICLANHRHITTVLQDYIASLGRTLSAIRSQEENALYQLFDDAREYRDSIPAASMGPLKKDYAIYCDIVDESGAIATIATILATHQINIKNIGIIHNREFEEGVLKVAFYDQASADAAAEWLAKFQYRLYKR